MFEGRLKSYPDQGNEHDILQLMRGFGILLVVLQHSVVLYFDTDFSGVFITVCVLIDVHVFMFVSGYLFQKYSDRYLGMGIKRFTVKKFRALIVPYIFWAGILFIGTFILYLLSDRYGIHIAESLGFQRFSPAQILVGLLTYRYYHMQLYWFLFALFWVFLINYLLMKCSRRPEWVLLCFVVIALMSVDLKADEYILIKICRSILTFLSGRLFRKYRLERFFMKNEAVLIVALTAFTALFHRLLNFPMNISDAHVKAVIQNLEIALLGILGIAAVYIISSFLASYKLRLTKAIKIIGDYSLPIYLLHNPWIVHVSNILFRKLSVPDWLGNIASIALGLVIPILLYRYVIQKNKLLSMITLGIDKVQTEKSAR